MSGPQANRHSSVPVEDRVPSSTGVWRANAPSTSGFDDSSTIHTPYYYCCWLLNTEEK